MIDSSPALREHEGSMLLRHAHALAEAIELNPDGPRTPTACRTIARFIVDAFSLARATDRPLATVHEVFCMMNPGLEDRFIRRTAGLAGTDLFRQDATFCLRPALDGSGRLSLESQRYPGRYVRHRGGEL